MMRPGQGAPRRSIGATMELLTAAVAAFGRDDLEVSPALVTPGALVGLADAADLHRVSGCAAPALRGVPGVPEAVIAGFEASHRRNAVRHMAMLRLLVEVGKVLDSANVRWLVMKGPVAASLLYRDAGARAYGDLDVLVHPADIESATTALERHGFEHLIRNWPLARWFRACEFSMRTGGIEVDLHWHLLYAWYDRRHVDIDLDALFERMRTVDVGGIATPTLDPVDTLWLLAVHASKSGGHRLMWLKDLERSLSVERPDLDELVKRARAAGCGARVAVPLARARELLGAEVGADVIDELMGSTALRAFDTAVSAVSPAVRVDQRQTISQRWNRSVRGSARSTASDAARRAARRVGEVTRRLPGGEDDDQVEKQRFLREVAADWDAPS